MGSLVSLVLLGFVAASAPAPRGVEVDAPVGGRSSTSSAVEVMPQPPPNALEEKLSGEIGRYYGAAIAGVRSGQNRRALTDVRQARVLAYRALQKGPTEHHLAQRHFTRVIYLEEQLSELVLIDEQLERPAERTEQRSLLLQLRALLVHNLFLAVRGFLGQSDGRLLKESIRAYQLALEEADNLKHSLMVGYAAMLAERGSRKEARLAFGKLSEHEREQEALDIAVAYYYLALGDRARSIARLITASHRDSWLHGPPGRDGNSFRNQVYRMNDFDRLRDHPRFIEMISAPEEQ